MLGLQSAIIAELETVKCDINQIFVEQEMLTLVIGEDHHEWLNQRISHVDLNQFGVSWVDQLYSNSFKVFRVFTFVLINLPVTFILILESKMFFCNPVSLWFIEDRYFSDWSRIVWLFLWWSIHLFSIHKKLSSKTKEGRCSFHRIWPFAAPLPFWQVRGWFPTRIIILDHTLNLLDLQMFFLIFRFSLFRHTFFAFFLYLTLILIDSPFCFLLDGFLFRNSVYVFLWFNCLAFNWFLLNVHCTKLIGASLFLLFFLHWCVSCIWDLLGSSLALYSAKLHRFLRTFR